MPTPGETLRATRGQAGDPLPAPQAREAVVTEAAKAPVAEEPRRVLTTEELIARAVARHRAQTQQATSTTEAASPHEPASPTPEPQKKESPVSETVEQPRKQTSGPAWHAQHAQVAKRIKAANRTEQKANRQEDQATATRRAADSARRDSGRSL